MKKREGLPVTDAIRQALDAVARAERLYVPGRDSAALIELPKLQLADAVLEAVGAVRTPRLHQFPTKARTAIVVDVEIYRKRRRRA